jgi:hypothetical protein
MQLYAGSVPQVDTQLHAAQQRRGGEAAKGERFVHIMPLLELYEPINLAQMDDMALMSRIDTKYLMGEPELRTILTSLVDDYWVLEVGGVRLNHYKTLYFDTQDLDLYMRHHMGRSIRYKVRSRLYLDSGASFLEVKRRTNKGRTIKDRLATEMLLTRLTPEADQFVDSVAPSSTRPLLPMLWNEFSRITLVSRCGPERVTLDLDLRFRTSGANSSLDKVAIVEVKQKSVDRTSQLIRQMRALGIRPTAFSKYCVGTAMLYPEVKHNRFLPVLRLVDQVMRGDHAD